MVNASVSPLRYPGGKAALATLLRDVRRVNGLGDRALAEPFAGGAGASVRLLFSEETPRIYINDADPAIADFWYSIVDRFDAFAAKLRSTRVSMAEWKRQRETYRNSGRVSRLSRGFAAFYLNRCNRSGVIQNGGPIGGLAQKGEWRLNARFNKATLLRRCQRIAEYRSRITVSQQDGIDFIRQYSNDRTLLFIDPPYYVKGPSLYLNGLDDTYHRALADELRSLTENAWVLTYDDCPEIRRLYRGWASLRPFGLRYVASERRQGRELLITPKWMRLPQLQGSAAVAW